MQTSRETEGLTATQRAILLTVLYSDLFDYPLGDDELRRYLTAPTPGKGLFERELAELTDRHLVRVDGLICLAGREGIVAVRRQRQQIRDRLWAPAHRYARWLRHVPFLRMVAVCGSHAAGNPRPDADVDFFLITESDRLWTVQVASMLLRRIASLLSVRVCPNYFLTLESLEVSPHNLYHAREVAQTIPLWGGDVHLQFLDANRWVGRFLPNLAHADDRRDRLEEAAQPRLARALEWLLGGWIGNVLERTLHRLLLLYYPARLSYLGWRRDHFRRAYRTDRQEVMRGGYGPIIEQAFRRSVAAHLGEAVAAAEMERLFPRPDGEPEADGLYTRLFSERYGGSHD